MLSGHDLCCAAQTGQRASELTSVGLADVTLGTGAHVQTLGKGRRERVTPIDGKPGRYRPPDPFLRFLESL